MPVALQILSGRRQGERIELDLPEFRAGDAPSCELFFDAAREPAVRGKLALFQLTADGWCVRNIGAAGVLVNDRPVSSATHLRSGDVVRLSAAGPDFSFQLIGHLSMKSGTVVSSPVSIAPVLPAAPVPSVLCADQSGTGGRMPVFELINVNSHSLGVVGTNTKTGQKVNVVLIRKNTPLPCRKTRMFRTAPDNQQSVKVSVVEGENKRPEYCIALGECVVRDLPPGLPAGSPVEVEYRYAANGTLSVWARVASARQSAFAEIHRDERRQLEDLETWRRRLSAPPAASGSKAPIAARPAHQTPPAHATPVAGIPMPLPVPPALPRAMPVGGAATHQAALLHTIDDCLVRLGEQLSARPLPSRIEPTRQALVSAAEELRSATAAVQALQAAPASAISASEAIQRNAQLTQALQNQQQAVTRHRFAQLSLARACLESGFVPREIQHEAARIVQLQAQLAAG